MSAKNGRRMLAAAAITAALGITLIAISFALTIPPRALSLPFDKVQIGMSLDEVTQTLRHPPGNYSFSHDNPPQSKYGFKCWVCEEGSLVIALADRRVAHISTRTLQPFWERWWESLRGSLRGSS